MWTIAEITETLVGSIWLSALRFLTTLFALWFLALEVKQLIYLGLRSYWKDFWNKVAVFTYLGTCCATALSEPMLPLGGDLRALGKTIRSYAACAAWMQLLAYLRGFASCAPYVRMLLEIISDLRVFFMIYVLITFAFAHAILVYDDEALRNKSVAEIGAELVRRVFATYRIGTLGDFDADEFVEQWQLHGLFNLCTFIVTVVLLNVLIAVISDTFDRLLERSESSSVKSRAQLIAEIEIIFGPKDPLPYIVLSQNGEGEVDEWNGRVGALKEKIDASQREILQVVSQMEANMTQMEDRSHKKIEEMQEMMAKMTQMKIEEMQNEMMAKFAQMEDRIEKLVMTLREEHRTSDQ